MRAIILTSLLVCAGTCSDSSIFSSGFLPDVFATHPPLKSELIPFNSNLPCGGCVRSGYDYCATDKTCVEKASDEELCSNVYNDKFNFMYNICKNAPACETPVHFNITDVDHMEDMEINGLKLGEQCTYHIETPCGYPRVNISMTNVQNADDFDFYYGYGEWNYTGELNPRLFKKLWFEGKNVAQAKGSDVKNKFIQFKKGEDKEAYEQCNGQRRNLYVAVTRVSQSIVPVVQSGRVLQDGPEKLNLIFGVYKGEEPDSAVARAACAIGLILSILLVNLTF